MEGEIHAYLKKIGLEWIKFKVTDLCANETKFRNLRSIADVVGINLKREEVRIIECKATKEDFIRDTKLMNIEKSYYKHCHYFYILCPEEIVNVSDIPKEYGLLWLNSDGNIDIIQKPTKYVGRLKTQYKTSLKNSCRANTNKIIFQQENKDNKDLTNGKFFRNANIKLISTKCPSCKKTERYLINKQTLTVNCKCGKTIDITKTKIREITGFNKKFIEEINKLNL